MSSLKNLGKKVAGFIEKIGMEKFIHFLASGWFTSIGMTFGFSTGALFFVVLIILSILKEKFLCEHFDFQRLTASIVGGMVAFLLYVPVDII